MKKLFYLCLCSVLLVAYSCKKEPVENNTVLHLAAINSKSSQIVNVNLESMKKTTFSIGCHVMSSATFNVKNKTFGYMACDNTYRIVDIEAGREIKQIPLAEAISFAVVDTIRNLLIGHYYNGTDRVVTINLTDGSIVSDKQFSNAFWDASTWFFRDIENEYVLLRSDNVLVFVNPPTGNVVKTLSLTTDAGNGVYDRKNNRLIGTTYEAGRNYIVTIDLNTGETLSKVVAQGLGFHLVAEMDYDAETNCYVLVSSNNEVLFFDVATGEMKDRIQLDFDLVSLKLWRDRG